MEAEWSSNGCPSLERRQMDEYPDQATNGRPSNERLFGLEKNHQKKLKPCIRQFRTALQTSGHVESRTNGGLGATN